VSLASQVEQLERETTLVRAVSGTTRQKRTLIRYQMHSVDDVAEHIHNKLKYTMTPNALVTVSTRS
jgi:type III restriction enzyme